MTKILTALSVSLVATTFSAGVAPAAEGEYYEGAFKQAAPKVDSQRTGSIARKAYGFSVSAKSDRLVRQPTSRDNRSMGDDRINSGDYYLGANRPN